MSAWSWADHACRFCGARLVVTGEAPARLYECGNCTAQSRGSPDGICGCGIHYGPRAWTEQDRKAREREHGPRFACQANPTRTPANPAAIVIVYGDYSR